jgi:hypothetical protein
MPLLHSDVLDNGLAVLTSAGTRVDICHTEPTTYAQATSSYSLGNKTGIAIGSPASRSPSGRKVTVPAITDGTVTATSTSTTDDAQYVAISDPATSRLLAAGPIEEAQLVYIGNQFTLEAFAIGIPGAA